MIIIYEILNDNIKTKTTRNYQFILFRYFYLSFSWMILFILAIYKFIKSQRKIKANPLIIAEKISIFKFSTTIL